MNSVSDRVIESASRAIEIIGPSDGDDEVKPELRRLFGDDDPWDDRFSLRANRVMFS